MEKTKEQLVQEMDNAASDAENDLTDISDVTLEIVANWWAKWYLKAGHKRLGRILVQHKTHGKK